MKKIISFFLALSLVITLLPAITFGAQAAESSGTCGDSVTWTFNSTTGTLTISGSGEMDDYSAPSDTFSPWHAFAVKTVQIDSGITSIGDYAFLAQDYLTNVSIPSSVTDIGDYAFHGCWDLPSVTLPNGLKHIGEKAFFSCYELTGISIPATVSDIGAGAFADCRILTSISVNASNNMFTSYNGMLFNKTMTKLLACPSSKTTATIPSNVTTIGGFAFYGTGISSITIPNSVLNIEESAFSNCDKLTSISIPSNVTAIGNAAFSLCDNLNTISIPNTITTINANMFTGSNKLTSITLPSRLESIGGYAFFAINLGFSQITIPDSVTSIGSYAFMGCGKLNTVRFEGNAPSSVGIHVFETCAEDFKIYYQTGTSGWSTPTWNEYTTEPYTQSVELSKNTLVLGKGRNTTLTATTLPITKTVTWSSSDSSIATVDNTGKITAVSAGIATITATATIGGIAQTATCEVTVPGIVISEPSSAISLNGSATLHATTYPNNATVIWSGSNSIATVDKLTGLITPKTVGTTTIGAAITVMDSLGNQDTLLDGCEVTVYDIALDKSELLMQIFENNTYTLAITRYPTEGNVSWNSSNTNIATVDSNGKVTAKSSGETTITASFTVGSKTASASCKVSVCGISLNKSSLSINVNASETLTATKIPSYGNVTWESADKTIATVKDGVVKGIGPGTVTITASMSANGKVLSTATCDVTVNNTYIDPHPYFIKPYSGGSMAGSNIVSKDISNNPERESFLYAVLSTSLAKASNEEYEAIKTKVYKLLFEAKYRPTAFGGTEAVNKTWPDQNYDCDRKSAKKSITDPALQTNSITWNRNCYGCLSYACFVASFVYSNPYTTCVSVINDPTTKKYVEDQFLLYLDPGEVLFYTYGIYAYPHAIVYLGDDEKHDGFYFVAYEGGRSKDGENYYDTIDVGYFTYEAFLNLTTTIKIFDTNGGSYTDSDGKVKNAVEVSKNMTLSTHCPVDMVIDLNGVILDSRDESQNLTTAFGSMTVTGYGQTRTVTAVLEYKDDYKIYFYGSETGTMTFSVVFRDDSGIIDSRIVENVPLSPTVTGTIDYLDPNADLELVMSNNNSSPVIWIASENQTVNEPDSIQLRCGIEEKNESSTSIVDTSVGIPNTNINSKTFTLTPNSSGISTLTESMLKTAESLSIKGTATLTFGKKAIDSLANAGGDVSVAITTADTSKLPKRALDIIGDRPVFNLTAKAGDKIISDFDGGKVDVEIPYTLKQHEDANSLVVYYIDAEGELNLIPNGVYDAVTKTVKFSVTHFSIYAIGYNEVVFNDVASTDWFRNAVTFNAARGITTGTGNGDFSPSSVMSRAMLFTVLYRLSGKTTDEAGTTWYSVAVNWAKEQGITDGTNPESSITREQLAAMLYRFAGSPDAAYAEISGFTDSSSISEWATPAMRWAVKAGIVTGKGNGILDPKGNASRAEVATILQRYITK